MDDDKFYLILVAIEDGKSVRSAIREARVSPRDFYGHVDRDTDTRTQYARSMSIGIDTLADDVLDIADEVVGTTQYGGMDSAAVNRNRLRVDARKWLLAKRMPKKYGDSVDITSDGEKITAIQWSVIGAGATPDSGDDTSPGDG